MINPATNCVSCEDRLCHVHITGDCLRGLNGEQILDLLQMNVAGVNPIHVVKREDKR